MNSEFLNKVSTNYLKSDRPDFGVGDTVEVSTIIREGDKQRIQKFKGLVISTKNAGISATFTVRKISSGIGVEKIFPLHSPNVAKIDIVKKGSVRRSKIYYMRERIGKSALKVKDGGAALEAEQVETADAE